MEKVGKTHIMQQAQKETNEWLANGSDSWNKNMAKHDLTAAPHNQDNVNYEYNIGSVLGGGSRITETHQTTTGRGTFMEMSHQEKPHA